MAIDTEFCPDCGGRIIMDHERGEKICDRCGLVIEDSIIDQGPDYRNFEGKENRAHDSSVSVSRSDGGKGNTLTMTGRDAYGKRIKGQNASLFRRLAKTNKRCMLEKGAKRSLATALKEIESICSQLGLGEQYVNSICYAYKRFVKGDGLRGRSVSVTVAAITYAECRKAGVSRTLEEISSVSGVHRRELGRAYRFVSRKMKYKLKTSDPSEYVERFGSNLGLSNTVISSAKSMLVGAMDVYIGKSPVSLAAAALYLSAEQCGEHRTQSQIGASCGVTEVTIRKICRIMQSSHETSDKSETTGQTTA